MSENVILEIGSPRFSRTLFSEIQRTLGIRQVVAYRFAPNKKVELLFAESADDDTNMNRVIRDYSQSLYFRDPIIEQMCPLPVRETRVHHVKANAIQDDTFRDKLYRTQKMASKTAIVVRRPTEALTIGLFRGDDAGELSGQQWDYIERSAGYIAAAVERHLEFVGRRDQNNWSSKLENIVEAFQLSEREIMVCRYILEGYFNEAIALNMGISVHSVITYRRRAFAKLQVNSQNQLFTLVMKSSVS